jgi:hypothetical protein
MRVFYIDEEEDKSKLTNERNYYVKVDNVNVPDDLKGFKAIKASSIVELTKKVMEYYRFNRNKDTAVQLWSNANYTGKRLDTMEEIPADIEFVWVRVVLNKSEI